MSVNHPPGTPATPKIFWILLFSYGTKSGALHLEAGRRCSTGEGVFIFNSAYSSQLVSQIQQAARQLKANAPPPKPVGPKPALRANRHGAPEPVLSTFGTDYAVANRNIQTVVAQPAIGRYPEQASYDNVPSFSSDPNKSPSMHQLDEVLKELGHVTCQSYDMADWCFRRTWQCTETLCPSSSCFSNKAFHFVFHNSTYFSIINYFIITKARFSLLVRRSSVWGLIFTN